MFFFFCDFRRYFRAIFDSRAILCRFTNFLLDLLILEIAHLLLEFRLDPWSLERVICASIFGVVLGSPFVLPSTFAQGEKLASEQPKAGAAARERRCDASVLAAVRASHGERRSGSAQAQLHSAAARASARGQARTGACSLWAAGSASVLLGRSSRPDADAAQARACGPACSPTCGPLLDRASRPHGAAICAQVVAGRRQRQAAAQGRRSASKSRPTTAGQTGRRQEQQGKFLPCLFEQ